jgi:hypothetical protein
VFENFIIPAELYRYIENILKLRKGKKHYINRKANRNTSPD